MESDLLASKQLKPRYIFMSLMDYLARRKIQVPVYSAIAEIITDSINKFEDKLVQNINQSLSDTEGECLDKLLTKNDDKNYLITKFKSHNHSIKLKKIRKNMESYKELESMFFQILPIAQRLELSPEVVRYYSEVVIKSQVFQIGRRDEKRYLYLISFIYLAICTQLPYIDSFFN